jgi:hypothetical protein
MVVTWRQGGVLWRGTLYTLPELRKSCAESYAESYADGE